MKIKKRLSQASWRPLIYLKDSFSVWIKKSSTLYVDTHLLLLYFCYHLLFCQGMKIHFFWITVRTVSKLESTIFLSEKIYQKRNFNPLQRTRICWKIIFLNKRAIVEECFSILLFNLLHSHTIHLPIATNHFLSDLFPVNS